MFILTFENHNVCASQVTEIEKQLALQKENKEALRGAASKLHVKQSRHFCVCAYILVKVVQRTGNKAIVCIIPLFCAWDPSKTSIIPIATFIYPKHK